MAPVAFFFLPDTPHKARFLNEDEKRIALARGVRQAGEEVRVGGINWKDVGATLLDIKPWLTGKSTISKSSHNALANST